MSLEEDRQLLLSVHADKRQFGLVYDKYYKPVFGCVYRRIADYDAARDITAETFLKAFLSIDKFQWRNISLSSWIYRIATNEVNMFFRGNKYTPLYLSQLTETGFDMADPQTTEAEKGELERKLKEYDEFKLIQEKLKLLPIKYQEVISLRYFEAKSIREIGEILGKNEGTVKSLSSRGLEKLRNLVQPK